MADTIKEYKKLILSHEFKIKELEIIEEKQSFYKNVVEDCKKKSTRAQIKQLKLELKAFKKQIPTKVIRDSMYSPALCPNCIKDTISKDLGDGYYTYQTDLKCCPECGQLLDWDN